MSQALVHENEVPITGEALDHGDEVDVHLTVAFEVIGTESDVDETEDDD